MIKPQTLTIRFEIHEGDVTEQFLWPLGQTALTEVVQASFDHDEWTISGNAGGIPLAGRGESVASAIFHYLEAHLIRKEARDI